MRAYFFKKKNIRRSISLNLAVLAAFFVFTANFFLIQFALAGTLSCSVTTAAACTGGTKTVILRMSGATNAHAELPSQSTAAYANNVVCCEGVTGLGTSCSGIFATVLKLSDVTNAHVQQSGSYPQSACISVPSGGSVSIGYQATNCTSPTLYDATLGSMTGTTNAHVGDDTAYTTKICATAAGAAAPTVSCSTDISSTDFGTWTDTSIKTSSLNASTTISCSNTSSGCTLYIKDAGSGSSPGLWKSASPTYLIASADATLQNGIEGYGIQATSTSPGLTIAAKYNQSGNTVGGLMTSNQTLASSSADISNAKVVVTHKAAISGATLSDSYSDTITYECTVN